MTKLLRESRGWTQETLALVSGLSVRTIQRVESGESPSAETLLALAAAFNLTPRDVGGRVGIVPVREWTQVVVFPNDGAKQRYWETPTKLVEHGLMPVGPVEVKRFHFEFPAGERPCLIVDRKVGRMVVHEGEPRLVTVPRRVIYPTFTEADLAEGETFEARLRAVVAAFLVNGFDDAEPGTGIQQITWATLAVAGEAPMHSMAATHFTFRASDLRFIASLNVIQHTMQSAGNSAA